jgi:hypothetical protein
MAGSKAFCLNKLIIIKMAGVYKIGVFDEEKSLIASIKSLQEKKLAIYDVHSLSYS